MKNIKTKTLDVSEKVVAATTPVLEKAKEAAIPVWEKTREATHTAMVNTYEVTTRAAENIKPTAEKVQYTKSVLSLLTGIIICLFLIRYLPMFPPDLKQ